ncbi:NADH-quinone oxidoreductase subunit NuoF [Dethiobacter alkaliphilus]|uniref:NADH-quinone oxidoreductase subunit NuoF n=1 Tax=Dethiobacter alkaliphilus TaxID=427926 RepID=UPI0029622A1A|nr:NADH-quinone oxidoreductase subunit NuoF [Dethiobacter alkaliphilus]
MTFYRGHLLVCGGEGCTSSGCNEVHGAFREAMRKKKIEDEIKIVQTGCHGYCEKGPLVVVYPEGVMYNRVGVKDASEIVNEHLVKGKPVTRLFLTDPISVDQVPKYEELDLFRKQHRIALRNCGMMDPDSVNEYIARGGYSGLAKMLDTMHPTEVVNEIKESGLRGRGGGGFPTATKWEFCSKAKSNKKYIICNADEGDPGAFMDRSLLEGDPHSVLEGMIIAGYAIGADEGYLYIRAEYPLAIKRIRNAINQAKELGLLGENILGSGFNMELKIKEGAGAFVCGEETALIASIEGERGVPRSRPPFPAVKGLFGKPTIINNVETLANIPYIIDQGAQTFASVGTDKSKGTKVFALTGKVKNSGLVEVPMGISVREIVYEIGGGTFEGKKFKAVQTGGPSGGCLPESKLDLPIDYDSLASAGTIMGSGGLVVMDEDSCMIDVAKYFLTFTRKESCGKCTPCREGTMRLLEMLEKITAGEGEMADLDRLERLAKTIKTSALCGLGQTAPNPILSTLQYFRKEYETHIKDKKCPAGVCQALFFYRIDDHICVGCGVCIKACPTDAIEGERKQAHHLDMEKCIKCGGCVDACPFHAVIKE